MGVNDYLPRAAKWKGRVVTSDPETGRIEVVLGDGAVRQVSMGTVNGIRRWPVEGEVWTVRNENNMWSLDERWEDDDATFASSNLAPGEAYIDADTIYNANGTPILSGRSQSWSQTLGEPGLLGQIKAGRPWTAKDFTDIGVTPSAIWNLDWDTVRGITSASTFADSSGNGQTLSVRASATAPMGVTGIQGLTGTGVQFDLSDACLYRDDTGPGNPLRIIQGSWGIWFRTPRWGIEQNLITKSSAAGSGYVLDIEPNGRMRVWVQNVADNTATAIIGKTFVSNDRWHLAVATYDGSLIRLIIDSYFDSSVQITTPGTIIATADPFNIGARGGSASVATGASIRACGRVGPAFVTNSILDEEQIAYLMAASVPHNLGSTPTKVNLSVTRRRRGRPTVSDFPSQPLRFHGSTASGAQQGSDSGSQAIGLSASAVAGGISGGPGPDGAAGGSWNMYGGHAGLYATDTGLPSGVSDVTIGCWFKTVSTGSMCIMGYGTLSTADLRLYTGAPNAGFIGTWNGADGVGLAASDIQTTNRRTGYTADGLWQFGVMTCTNTPRDGVVKRKVYLNGEYAIGSTVYNTVTLAGTSGFRIGNNPQTGGTVTSSAPFLGSIARPFVTNYVMDGDTIAEIYHASVRAIKKAYTDAGPFIQGADENNLYVLFDTIDPQNILDFMVEV